MAANATVTEATAAKAKAALAKVLRQRNNENTAKLFAAGMVSMIILFVIFHWTKHIFNKYASKKGFPTALVNPVLFTRTTRSFLIRKAPGFTSFGHALIFMGWFATCSTIAFVNIDWSTLNGLAKRLGWVAISNLALVTFLSLKNTPLAFLTSYSYERLNSLHQVAGYGTIFWTFLHAVVYINAWAKGKQLRDLLETANVVGWVASFAMLIILATALFLRKLRYEVFYIIHIIMFVLILVMVGLHRPDFTKHTIIITIFTASIWIADRALRLLKITFFSFRNSATITPLAHGGTRIVLRWSSPGAVAGTHAFLWIPTIRATETHPFTIVSTNPLEFVIAAYDGFTSDLHNYALKNPGKALKASIDGPYGTVPDFTAFSKVVFIAGGSGASFAFGVAVDLIRKLGHSTTTKIEFVWAVREKESITWFTKELSELQLSPLITLSIHSTRHTLPTPTSCSSTSSLSDDSDPEKNLRKTALPKIEAILASPVSQDLDVEKHIPFPPSLATQIRPTQIKAGRPDVARIIREAIRTAEGSDKIAVAACGPDAIMQVTRRTVADCISGDGSSVELFLEQFGW